MSFDRRLARKTLDEEDTVTKMVWSDEDVECKDSVIYESKLFWYWSRIFINYIAFHVKMSVSLHCKLTK